MLPIHLQVESVSERPEHVDRVSRAHARERARAGTDGVDQERELSGWRLAQAHRARKEPSGSFEHEELPGRAGIEGAALEPQQRVRPDPFGAGDAMPTG